jgi:hypothetical protein
MFAGTDSRSDGQNALAGKGCARRPVERGHGLLSSLSAMNPLPRSTLIPTVMVYNMLTQ